MKKLTLALVLIAAFCLFAVSPVVAAVTDPFAPAAGNITAKYSLNTNAVSFPTATYKPSIDKTLDKAFTALAYKPSIDKTLDKVFLVPAMTAIKTSNGGYLSVIKFPWEL
jgi:hypothetical protein